MLHYSAFKSSFKGDLILPEDPDFPNAISRWSVTAERKAAVVAFAKDEDDVALAIKYAKSNNLEIAIRGGGHNCGGASSSEGGLVIDLSRYLNGARVDPEKRLVSVGGGALWEVVDKEAIKHGLATVAGTVNHTGVGGLTLGGGFGWLSGSYSLVIDNLVQATVVTASGTTVTASESSHPDLFWGIRGGGCNFGVVTEFVFKLYPQRATVYTGKLEFSPSQVSKLVEVTAEWYRNISEKEAMVQAVRAGPDGIPSILCLVFYNGSEAEGRTAFKAFLDLGPISDSTKELPYELVNTLQNENTYQGQGFYIKGVAPRQAPYKNMASAIQRVGEIAKSPQSTGIRPAVFFEYYPLRKIHSVPMDATAFKRDLAPTILTFVSWPGDKDKELVNGKTKVEVGREISNQLADVVSRGHDDFASTYTNYDVEAEVQPDKAKMVFGTNYPRMQKVKKEWDPENVFHKWYPITPA